MGKFTKTEKDKSWRLTMVRSIGLDWIGLILFAFGLVAILI